MASKIDPYHQWLSIPPKDQPPNHYRLLGVEMFESNLDVIENAADQRMAYIRTFASGKHSALSQKVLNELAAAKIVLLNKEKRAAYDKQLRAKQAAASKEKVAEPPAGLAVAKPIPPAPPDAPPAAGPVAVGAQPLVAKPVAAQPLAAQPVASADGAGFSMGSGSGDFRVSASRRRRSKSSSGPMLVALGLAAAVAIGVGVFVMSSRQHSNETAKEKPHDTSTKDPGKTTEDGKTPDAKSRKDDSTDPSKKPGDPGKRLDPAKKPADPTKKTNPDERPKTDVADFAPIPRRDPAPIEVDGIESAAIVQLPLSVTEKRTPGEVFRATAAGASHGAVAADLDGKTIAATGPNGGVILYTIETMGNGEPLQATTGTAVDLAFTDKGRTLVHAALPGDPQSPLLFWWNVETRQQTRSLPSDPQMQKIGRIAVPQVGDRLAIFAEPRSAVLFVGEGDMIDSKPLRSRATPEARMIAGAFTPGGEYLAALGTDGRVRAWKCGDGKLELLAEQESSTREVPGIAVSPGDGKYLVTPGDQRLLLWSDWTSAQPWKLRQEFRGLNGDARSIRFSPDGKLLAACSADGLICVWNVVSAELLHSFDARTSAPRAIDFLPNNKYLASTGSQFVLWRVTGKSAGTTVASNPETKPKRPDPFNVGDPDNPDSKNPEKTEEKRLPPPAAEDVQKAIEAVRTVLSDDFSAAKKPPEKATLAEKLLKLSEEEKDGLQRYALLEASRTLAIDGLKPDLALRAIDSLEGYYEIDVWQIKNDTLADLSKRTLPAEGYVAVADLASALVDAAEDSDKLDLAQKLLTTMNSAANKSGDVDLKKRTAERIADLKKRRAAWEAARKAEETLAENANDAQAHLVVGKYQAFLRGDWEEGAKHLAAGADAALAEVAKKEAAGAEDTKAQIALGDAWWDWAQSAPAADKQHALQRARYWYSEGVGALSALEKVRVENRIQVAEGPAPKVNPKRSSEWLKGPVGEFKSVDVGLELHAVAVSPDARIVAAGAQNGSLLLYELPSLKLLKTIPGPNGITALAFLANGRQLLVCNGASHLPIIDVQTGSQVGLLQGKQSAVSDISVSANGRFIASCAQRDFTSPLRIWDVARRAPVLPVLGPVLGPSRIALSPDARYLAVATRSRNQPPRLGVFEVPTGKVLANLEANYEQVHGIQFSPDNRYIVVYGNPQFDSLPVRVYDAKMQGEVGGIKLNRGVSRAAVFSPDAKTMLIGAGNQLSLYDLTAKQDVSEFSGQHTSPVRGIAYLPDGLGAVSVGEDNHVRVWKLPESK